MDLERWKQVESVAQAALDQPAAEREPFLRSACGGDDALEREVRSLLSVEHRAGKFLESPALEAEAKALARENEQEAEERDGSWIGRTISHYSILEKVGEGGMGVVWKARDTRLDRLVALKFLPAGRVMDGGQRWRFLQEAQAASALNHPNIVTVYDIDEMGADGSFIAMEFVPGESLDALIARKRIRLNEALDCMIQVAEALEAAHQAGIVHRDLKPGNIMLRQGGRVKVVDFGLAKLPEQGPHGELHKIPATAISRSLEGMITGTASYMSPEQAEGRKLDARTDIFSFGAVLYEVITGRRAFDGDSAASTISAVLRDQPIPVAQIVNGIPRGLERIVTRCLEKNAGRRYQHAGDLKIDLQQVKEDLIAGSAALPITPKLRPRHWWWVAAGAVCLMASLALGWWLHNAPSPLTAVSLSQLTNDAGLSDYPALSPDGKLVAYSSDRSLNGERDLYVKQVAGGAAIRLTFDGADNTEPNFSPDGAKIVFRSNRDGGGIYEIPAFGGEPRLLTRNGRNPKFSPDGSQVAYWRGDDRVAETVPGNSVWIVPTGGGSEVRIGENLTAARDPIWSPDGKHLLVIGYASPTAGDASSLDWWFVPANGGNAVRSGFYRAAIRAGLQAHELNFTLKMEGLPAVPRPAWWAPVSNTILFSASLGDRTNLWKLGISPRTGRVNGVFDRITVGSANEIHASAMFGDTVAFANAESRNDVWSLPFDLDRGVAKSPLERVTNGPAWREQSSLSRNGRYVAFASDQSGSRVSIWLRELSSGKESTVAGSLTAVQRYPVFSPEGDRVAFSAFEKEKRSVYLAVPGATPEKLCEGCLRATDWAADGKSLLIFGGAPYRISVVDVRSHVQTAILRHPIYNLLYARFSSDSRWVSFTVRTDSNHGRIVIAPLEGLKPVPEDRWITIGEAGAQDWAEWSPDGKTLYFMSPRDGHYCLWAQRIDAASHRPAGDAFAAQHFHGPMFYQAGMGWSAAGGRIAVVLTEGAGNIWLMSRAAAR